MESRAGCFLLHKRNRDISASPTRVIIHQQSAQCARRLRGTHKGSRGALPRDRLCATAPAAPVVADSKGSARRVSSSRRAESKEMYDGATELRGCRSDHQISCAGQKKKTRAIGPQTQRRGGRRARPGHLHGWRGWARNRRSTSQGRVSTSARFGQLKAAPGLLILARENAPPTPEPPDDATSARTRNFGVRCSCCVLH